MGTTLQNKTRHPKAQAATEVAIFGAMIIFLIGMMIRLTISSQYNQNQNFKAFRLALAKSLESSQAGKTERNNASVLYIEDRLVPDFNKYGSLERTPFVAQGGGSMTHMMMYPVDEEDVDNSIPKLDVFINGQYYPFTTAALRAKILVPPDKNIETTPLIFEYNNQKMEQKNEVIRTGWDKLCRCEDKGADAKTCYPCPVFFQSVVKGTAEFCTKFPCPGYLIYPEERFNLNLNGNFNDDPPEYPLAGQSVGRNMISWQWEGFPAYEGTSKNPGFEKDLDAKAGRYPSVDVDNDRKEETVYAYNRVNWDTIEDTNALQPKGMTKEMVEDIRAQLAEAKKKIPEIVDIYKTLRKHNIITDVLVVDYQDGDIDLSHDSSSPGMMRGLQNETAIYTRMRQEKGETVDKGTYFLIKEGKLYNPENGDMVRSVNKRDQLDLVERHFLLSNDTKRFCRRGVPPTCIADLVNKKGECEVAPNPVEVCTTGTGDQERSGCFSENNVSRTCLDTGNKMLYVRSRIINRGGHKWITDVTDKRPAITIR